MTLRRGHGRGAGSPRIETMPLDEALAGVPDVRGPVTSARADQLREDIAATRVALAAVERGKGARIAPGESARLLARLGGLQRSLNCELDRLAAERASELATLASELLPGMLASDAEFARSLPLALDFVRVETAELAQLVGGGTCPNGPASMVVSAALQMVASRVLFARGDFRTASALANDSRQNIAAAHEYTAKLATARRAVTPPATPSWMLPEETGR